MYKKLYAKVAYKNGSFIWKEENQINSVHQYFLCLSKYKWREMRYLVNVKKPQKLY